MASKELSPVAAWALVVGLAAVGVTLATRYFGTFIGGLYFFGLFLGTIYSIPPFRLKRFAIPAFLIIAMVRGFLLNFGVYYATRAALQLPFAWSPAIRYGPLCSFVHIWEDVFQFHYCIRGGVRHIDRHYQRSARHQRRSAFQHSNLRHPHGRPKNHLDWYSAVKTCLRVHF